MSVTFVGSILVVLCFAAVSADLGHYFVVRDELQSAADAAALSGAGKLFPATPSPNWSAAAANAATAVRLNSANNVSLTDATVQTGYWNLSGSPAGMQSQTIVPGPYDNPAIQVTVSLAQGLNSGPLKYFFAPLFGIQTTAVSAHAVAVVSAPGYFAPGGIFPMALNKCVFDQYWNSTTGAPKIDPTTGSAYEFQIGSGSSDATCATGQWTSFLTNSNSVPAVRDLITDGNPTGLGIGDAIWIESGVKTTLYSSVPTNVTVVVPVVQQISSSIEVIVAFAAFHIDSSAGGSTKAIQGHFVSNFQISSSTGESGPYYGAYVPPRLAQ
jgi:Flp pilus assembly protein TadG